jgi:hypothetical protein
VTNDTGAAAGWYADPMRRYDHRYYNGAAWTSDVSTGGERFVDPLGIEPTPSTPERPGHPGVATAAMVLGIVAISLAWVPFVVALGLLAAVLAIVLGAVGLRRARRTGANRAFAVVGIATGAGALVVAIVGIALSVLVYDAYEAYLDPAPNETAVVGCTLEGARATLRGELVNLGTETEDFSVLVAFVRPGTDNPERSQRVSIDDVAPGDTAVFEAEAQVRLAEIDCLVLEVNGPLPFGIVVD